MSGWGQLVVSGVWGQQEARACLRADGQTVGDAGLYSQEGRQRSGIKASTDSPPGRPRTQSEELLWLAALCSLCN